MAVITNTITSQDINAALDVELASKFTAEFNKLREFMGIFGVERVHAGQALYQLTITGTATPQGTEGDEIPLSKYTVEKSYVGEIEAFNYRKLTTGQAIIKNGYIGAVARTDEKMLAQVRASLIGGFVSSLANGVEAAGNASTLQEAIALAGAAVLDAVETNGDAASGVVYFINRQDAAAYLANAPITTQNVFGMTYLENFLGAERVFLSSTVPDGAVVATPIENIHVYAIDWADLAQSGLDFYAAEDGIIGVHHEGNYARNASETFVMVAGTIHPEVTNYIKKYVISEG